VVWKLLKTFMIKHQIPQDMEARKVTWMWLQKLQLDIRFSYSLWVSYKYSQDIYPSQNLDEPNKVGNLKGSFLARVSDKFPSHMLQVGNS
jgi:hypothetical protein